MRTPSYYSSSRKQWVPVNMMANHHLVNALAKGDCTEDEADALKVEILRRLNTNVRTTTEVKPVRLTVGEAVFTTGPALVSLVTTPQGAIAIINPTEA